jgi:hypothetical protein
MKHGVLILAAVLLAPTAHTAPVPRVLAEGAWSKAVADSRGYALRGRLVVTETQKAPDSREAAVFVELQDASDFVGSTMRVYSDFRIPPPGPAGGAGLKCELLDRNKKPVASEPVPFGGGVPAPQWVNLPSQATIRLRASPFGIHRPGAMVLCPQLGSYWTLRDDDPHEYFLSATLTVEGPAPPEGAAEHVWRGTIVLPSLRVRNGRGRLLGAVTPRPALPGAGGSAG